MSELSSEVIRRKTQFHSNHNSVLGIEVPASVNKVFGLHPGLVDAVDFCLELSPCRRLFAHRILPA